MKEEPWGEGSVREKSINGEDQEEKKYGIRESRWRKESRSGQGEEKARGRFGRHAERSNRKSSKRRINKIIANQPYKQATGVDGLQTTKESQY